MRLSEFDVAETANKGAASPQWSPFNQQSAFLRLCGFPSIPGCEEVNLPPFVFAFPSLLHRHMYISHWEWRWLHQSSSRAIKSVSCFTSVAIQIAKRDILLPISKWYIGKEQPLFFAWSRQWQLRVLLLVKLFVEFASEKCFQCHLKGKQIPRITLKNFDAEKTFVTELTAEKKVHSVAENTKLNSLRLLFLFLTYRLLTKIIENKFRHFFSINRAWRRNL